MYVDMESRSGSADADAARRYVATWQSLPPRERNAHMPEQICELASVLPADLIAWVTRQIWIEGSAKTSVVMSFMRDRVLEKTAEFAMAAPENYKHAELFYKTAGMMPAASRGVGSPVTIFNAPVASSGSVALAGAKSESSPVVSAGLRDMDSEIVELSKIMQTGGEHDHTLDRMDDGDDEDDEDDGDDDDDPDDDDPDDDDDDE